MNFLKNYFSSLSFLYFAYFFYTQNQTFLNFAWGNIGFTFNNFSIEIFWVFSFILYAYVILFIPYYLIYGSPSKARLVYIYIWEILKGSKNYDERHKNALLAWIVKLFFAPLMLVWITSHTFNLINYSYDAYSQIGNWSFLIFFNSYFFIWAFTAILFFDVLFFTLWYLLEWPVFKNTIKSVQPSFIGWAVVLICYPPLNNNLTNLVGWYSQDFPQFTSAFIHVPLNISILILMCIYAWASISLGLKASNLTNRWIVRKWPYKFVRHPAYICKNLSWLIWWIPMLLVSFSDINITTSAVLFWLTSWTFVYYMRAMTEEDHLSLDPDYIKYKQQVPYKFIPKVW